MSEKPIYCGAATLTFLLVAVTGCGSGGPVPLRGTVTLDGRPLEGATVHFIAQDSGGRDALGTTDADGVFHLSTAVPGDGALPGTYKVVVHPVAPATGGSVASPADAMAAPPPKPARPPIVLPPCYSQPGQTILVQKVPPDGDVVFDLHSTPPRPR